MNTPQGSEIVPILPFLKRASRTAGVVGFASIMAATAAGCSGDVELENQAVSSTTSATSTTSGVGGSGGNELPVGSGGIGGFVEAAGTGGAGGMGGSAGAGGGQAGGPQFLTRGELVDELVHDVMGRVDDGTCVPNFSDIPADSELCDAIDALQKRGLLVDGGGGMFYPESTLLRAEVWKILPDALGFAKYNAPCLTGIADLDPANWSYTSIGAVCEKNIGITQLDGLAHPLEQMTLGDWATLKSELGNYFSAPLTRAVAAEIAEVVLRTVAIPSTPQCVSYFSDVPNDTLNCFTINDLVDNGLMQGYVDANGNLTGMFGPDDFFPNSQMAQLYVQAKQLPLDACDSCSGLPAGAWDCAYADTLCHEGLVDNNFDPNGLPSRGNAYSLAWNVDAGEKLF